MSFQTGLRGQVGSSEDHHLSRVFGGRLAACWNRLTSAGTPGWSFTGSPPPGRGPDLLPCGSRLVRIDSGIVQCFWGLDSEMTRHLYYMLSVKAIRKPTVSSRSEGTGSLLDEKCSWSYIAKSTDAGWGETRSLFVLPLYPSLPSSDCHLGFDVLHSHGLIYSFKACL